jgi:hypothetical protein
MTAWLYWKRRFGRWWIIIFSAAAFASSNLILGFPVITSVSPTSGAPGTSVDIKGSDLSQTMEVRFGMASAIFTVLSDFEVVATVPLDASSGPVSIIANNGVAVTFGDFLVPPRITRLSPSSGPIGAVVLILGDNFEGTTNVTFNGTPAVSFGVTSQTQIHATAPDGATSGPVTVTTPLGTATSGGNFVVTGNGPFINSFNPTQGQPGVAVTISGVNFTGTRFVQFNGINASSFAVTSPNQLRAVVPSSASSGPITVSNAVGSATSDSIFVITTAPTISNFDPIGGAPGTPVTINGANFSGATSVTFGRTATTSLSVVAPTQLHTVVPTGATIGPITITTPQGSGSSAALFLATTDPIVTDVSPGIAAPGTIVVVNGSNFAGTSSVQFNGVAAKFSVVAATQLNATVPSGATSGPLTISNAGGTTIALNPFLVRTGKPLIVDITPQAGAFRQTVIIDGLDLANATAVRFNGVNAPFTATADTQITTQVPDGATTGPISITTPAGTVSSTNNFIVAPRLVSFSPTSGAAGTTVTVRGTNLTPVIALRFRDGEAFVLSAATNQLIARVPDDGTTGSINLITPAGIVATTDFFIVPPTVRSLMPPSGVPGTRVNILGTGFQDVNSVAFGTGQTTAFTLLSATQLVAVVPSQAVSGPVTVTTSSGSASSTQSFIVGVAVDLAVLANQSTNLLLEQQVQTYALLVTNQGPSAATSVTLLDDFPDSFTLLSAMATQGRLTTNGSQLRLDAGTLLPGGSLRLTITNLATDPGVFTNVVSVSSTEPDLDPTDNSVQQRATVVNSPAELSLLPGAPAHTLNIAWPVTATNFVLQSTASLNAGHIWQAVGGVPNVIGTQKVVNVPVTSASRVYRLIRP